MKRNRLADTYLKKDALTDFRTDFRTDFMMYSPVLCFPSAFPLATQESRRQAKNG